MSTPTFDEVLTDARQLPVEDQIRLRASLPATPIGQELPPEDFSARDGNPFRFLAGLIDEEPQRHLSAEDQEIYGQ